MAEPNRYSIPIEDLEAGARIPVADQVQVQDELRLFGDVHGPGDPAVAGDALGDADGS